MLGSLMNVTTVRISRITAAPAVQPISSLVLPWVWCATGCRLARKRNTATNSAPSTATNTIAATISTITYSVWIELAFGEPPDFGVMKFANAPGARIRLAATTASAGITRSAATSTSRSRSGSGRPVLTLC